MKPLNLLLSCALLSVIGATANAATSLVTTRLALGGNDFIDWADAGPEFQALGSSFSIMSDDGMNVTVNGNTMERRNQPSGWNGNFSSGDALVMEWIAGNAISINPQNLISGAGANIQANLWDGFVARIEAFDSSNTSLGFFDVNGFSTPNNDGSAIFIGIESDSANIDRIQFSVLAEVGFAINQVDLVTDGTNPVPEPSAIFGGLALGALALRRITRRK